MFVVYRRRSFNTHHFKMLKFILIASVVQCSFGANILFVDLLPSPSHHIWNEVLVEGLLGNGHNVTKVGHFPATIKNPNYTLVHIDVDALLEAKSSFLEDMTNGSTLSGIISVWMYTTPICNHDFNSKEFKALLDYPKKFFELIIFDVTFAHCYFPLIDHFRRPPVIGVTAFGMQPYINEMIGQRTESYVPFYSLPYTGQMNFFQRFNNVLHQTWERLCKWYFMPEITKASRKFFREDIPNLAEYERSISLIFSNDNPLLDYPKTFPPNVIPVGGIHLKKPKKLDDDLQEIMDKAKVGVIFVSMGSNFKSEHYSESAKKAFVEAFSRLNLTVLWKFEGIDAPKNVILRKWFSQTDILAHPNTKLFITHCGGLSSQETIVRGVPIVGLPLFFDQQLKATKFKSIKAGVVLKYSDLTADILYNAIREVLSDPQYKQNILKLSTLYQSQPQKPMDQFLLWTEYVLKNGHLDHLSVAARDMRWYEIDNWDIFAFISATVGILIIFLKKLCCFMKRENTKINRKQKQH